MEEMKNELVEVRVENNTIGITKGYSYTNKEGKTRYTYNPVYYVDGGVTKRKYTNALGDIYQNIELIDVVVETFLMKDGTPGSKTYPLSEVPYLAKDSDSVDKDLLTHFLEFKLHR